jgi:hypothetical protein
LPNPQDVQSHVVPLYQDWRKALVILSIVRVSFIVTNLSYPPNGIVHFYNSRGTAEQWIKEGKYALTLYQIYNSVIIIWLALGQSRLSGGQPGHGHPVRGAAYVVQTSTMTEGHAGRVSPVLTTDAQLNIRSGLPSRGHGHMYQDSNTF